MPLEYVVKTFLEYLVCRLLLEKKNRDERRVGEVPSLEPRLLHVEETEVRIPQWSFLLHHLLPREFAHRHRSESGGTGKTVLARPYAEVNVPPVGFELLPGDRGDGVHRRRDPPLPCLSTNPVNLIHNP